MMVPFGSEAKESAGHRRIPCLACVKGEAPHTSLEVLWGFAFSSGCGCQARVSGRILLEGPKAALGRCASSSFRVVVAV